MICKILKGGLCVDKITSTMRVRMSAKDAHYGGNLVAGGRMLRLLGDVITELSIKAKGDEGLSMKYYDIEFLAPVYAGDYIEAYGEIVKFGNTPMVMELIATKVIAARPDVGPSAADALSEPVPVCKSNAIVVVPKEFARK